MNLRISIGLTLIVAESYVVSSMVFRTVLFGKVDSIYSEPALLYNFSILILLFLSGQVIFTKAKKQLGSKIISTGSRALVLVGVSATLGNWLIPLLVFLISTFFLFRRN